MPPSFEKGGSNCDLFLRFSLSIVSKCCLKNIILAILDLPQPMLSGFLLVRFCLFLKFLSHSSPGPASELNLFGWSLFLAIVQATAFTAAIDRG